MKLRSLLLVAVGIGIGYSIAAKMREDDPDVVRGPAATAVHERSHAAARVRRRAAHRRSGRRPQPRCDPSRQGGDPLPALGVRRVRQRRELELIGSSEDALSQLVGQRVPNVTAPVFDAVQSAGAASRSTA